MVKISVAALVVIASLIVLYTNRGKKQQATAQAGIAIAHVVSFKNNTGEKTTIYLHDGSQVELATGSELRYEQPFGPLHRHVYLSGKGFFKVAKDPSKPFTVYSHDIATTALGTSFTITAWPHEHHVVVALQTGKVVVQYIIQKTH